MSVIERANSAELFGGDLVRVPGLFRRWELDLVLAEVGAARIEEAGTTTEGTKLFAVYRRRSLEPTQEKEI